MAHYVDGYVVPVPKSKKKAYLSMARRAAKVWRDHGALEVRECWADDVKPGKRTSFPQSVKLKRGEAVGYSYAAAAQSALMIREAVRIPTASYETYQYLHGPMESGRRGTGLLVFGDGRELPMIASQLEAGVRVLLVTAASDEQLDAIAHENLLVVRLPRAEEGIARAVVEVVVVQLLTEAMAAARAITIEEFLYEQDDTKMKEAAHP